MRPGNDWRKGVAVLVGLRCQGVKEAAQIVMMATLKVVDQTMEVFAAKREPYVEQEYRTRKDAPPYHALFLPPTRRPTHVFSSHGIFC